MEREKPKSNKGKSKKTDSKLTRRKVLKGAAVGGAAAVVGISGCTQQAAEYACPYCDKTFESESALKTHIGEKHSDQITETITKNSCPYCDATYDSKTELKEHISKAHSDYITETITKTIYACPYCAATYTQPSKLEGHIMTQHPKKVGELPKSKGKIKQLSINEAACSSCGTCELVCGLVHEGEQGSEAKRIWLNRNDFEANFDIAACKQCDSPECYYACPVEGAMYIDQETGARCINEEKCTGCELCIEACPFDPPRINLNTEKNVAIKCDLCKDREGGPACVEFCTQQCLKLVEKG